MSTPEAKRRAEKNTRRRRRERGYLPVSVELSPQAAAALKTLTERHGSKTAAVEAAILAQAARGER